MVMSLMELRTKNDCWQRPAAIYPRSKTDHIQWLAVTSQRGQKPLSVKAAKEISTI
jgi:hypothetical protein